VSPVLGRKALPAITKRDLVEVLDRVPATSPALPRNLFALMRKLFKWAVERGELDRFLMDNMKPPAPVESRDRVLNDEEILMVALCAEDAGEVFGAMIRLLIVTGQRRDEVAVMTWREVHRSRREWSLPGTRAKNGVASTVPLSDITVRELDIMAGASTWPRTGFVFTTTGKMPVSGFSKVKRRLDTLVSAKLGYEPTPWRLYDLRRTFASNISGWACGSKSRKPC
jgi:integrase